MNIKSQIVVTLQYAIDADRLAYEIMTDAEIAETVIHIKSPTVIVDRPTDERQQFSKGPMVRYEDME